MQNTSRFISLKPPVKTWYIGTTIVLTFQMWKLSLNLPKERGKTTSKLE